MKKLRLHESADCRYEITCEFIKLEVPGKAAKILDNGPIFEDLKELQNYVERLVQRSLKVDCYGIDLYFDSMHIYADLKISETIIGGQLTDSVHIILEDVSVYKICEAPIATIF